jgi:hypothetical protein
VDIQSGVCSKAVTEWGPGSCITSMNREKNVLEVFEGAMSHTFNVEMVEEHEDGSATFTVSGDKASMQALFEAFFTQALINGIEHAVESKDHWVAERKLLNAAVEFNKAVWAWEEFEGVDWLDLKRFHEKFDEAVKAYQKK